MFAFLDDEMNALAYKNNEVRMLVSGVNILGQSSCDYQYIVLFKYFAERNPHLHTPPRDCGARSSSTVLTT